MKIAFLFLIINNIYHESCWLNFFKAHENNYTIYIHSKYPMVNSVFKKYEIPKKVSTTWKNTMRAQIELLKEALKDPLNSKFVFLSESTIPLQAFDYVYQTLTKHPYSQFNFLPNYNRDRNFKPIPFNKQYKNSQWIVLNRKHAQMMVEDKSYIKVFDRYGHDQEHYPSTFLINKGLKGEIVKESTTLVIWPHNKNANPHTFVKLEEDSHLKRLINTIISKKFLFARKFALQCNLLPLAIYTPELFA